MRRPLSVLLLAIAAVTVPGPRDIAAASCAGPMLQVGDQAHPVMTRGAPVTVEGKFFTVGCGDSISVTEGIGCSASKVHRDPIVPMQDVTLSIRQGGHAWELGTADAGTSGDRLGRVRWTVVLPPSLRPGRAVLVADESQRLRVVVTP
jgi:hypothetical protein